MSDFSLTLVLQINGSWGSVLLIIFYVEKLSADFREIKKGSSFCDDPELKVR